MTPEQLLKNALASASPDEAGLCILREHIEDAEKTLSGARTALEESEAAKARLLEQEASIEARLKVLGKEAAIGRPARARRILEAIGDPKGKRDVAGVIADWAARRDEIATLRDVLDYLRSAMMPTVAVSRTEAEIGVARASLAWAQASAHFDLLQAQILIAPVLQYDESLTVSVGPGSHAFVFTKSINDFELRISALQQKLNEERTIAQKKMEAA